jgi:hypothetical protein
VALSSALRLHHRCDTGRICLRFIGLSNKIYFLIDFSFIPTPFTYDHRTLKTRLPVRSALFKQRTSGLVVRWVNTSEYPLLYVFCHCFRLVVVPCKQSRLALTVSLPHRVLLSMLRMDTGIARCAINCLSKEKQLANRDIAAWIFAQG